MKITEAIRIRPQSATLTGEVNLQPRARVINKPWPIALFQRVEVLLARLTSSGPGACRGATGRFLCAKPAQAPAPRRGFLLCVLRDLCVSIECFRIIRTLAVLLVGALVFPGLAFAHLGPPFPIMVDQPISGYVVNVLANPDTSQAVCIVLLDPGQSKAVVPVADIKVWVQPVSRRLPKAVYPMTQEPGRGPLRFVGQPEFDAAEMWTLGIDLHFANGRDEHLLTRVEATPPGIGPWGLLFFLFPFMLFGGLGLLVFIRRSRRKAPKMAAPASTMIKETPEN